MTIRSQTLGRNVELNGEAAVQDGFEKEAAKLLEVKETELSLRCRQDLQGYGETTKP